MNPHKRDIEVLVLYYSLHGRTATMAQHIARGVEEVADARARLRTVPPVSSGLSETTPRAKAVPDDGPPWVIRQDLADCDALVLGQFSAARAAAGIPKAPGRKIVTSPHSAVTRLKQIFDVR